MHTVTGFARTAEIGISGPNGPIYEVYCVDCGSSIGTMTGDMVARAIHHNLTRGGTKCTVCRERSCQSCGCPDTAPYCTLCKLEADEVLRIKEGSDRDNGGNITLSSLAYLNNIMGGK